MKITITALILGIILWILTLISKGAQKSANDDIDLQLRIPMHLQALPDQGKIGLGAWAVLPNVAADQNNTALLLVAGPLWQYGSHGSWLELMGGSRINDDGFVDPLINIRLLDKSLSRLNFCTDLEYFPREEHQRFYSLTYIDTPIHLGKLNARIGIESEDILSLTKAKDSFGIGPRLTYPLPIKSPVLSAAITAAYEVRTDRDFVRFYLNITYRPFSKHKW